MFNRIKNNLLIADFIFVIFNICLNFCLYLFEIRFRLWVMFLIVAVSIIGFVIGVVQRIYQLSENAKGIILKALLYSIPIVLLVIVLTSIVGFNAIIKYEKERTTTLDDQKLVAVVNSHSHVDVDYYDYYGPLLMGTEVRIHGDFGKGDFDPFESSNSIYDVVYTYYDDNGKAQKQKHVSYIRDGNGNVINRNVYEKNIDEKDSFNQNDNYILPEDEEVLYEKKFGDTILRFGKLDNVLGQNMLVNVLRSQDGGKNFYTLSEDAVQVSNEAKFVFLDESQGFIIVTGKVYLDGRKPGLYVTNDSGKNFVDAKFKYENANVDHMSIDSLPYIENGVLKIKCSVYQINNSGDGYENKELSFISRDEGENWTLAQ